MRNFNKIRKIRRERAAMIGAIILLSIGMIILLNNPSKPIESETIIIMDQEEPVIAEALSYLIVEKPEEEMPVYKSLGMFKITHYCDCEICQGKWVGQTASGKEPQAFYTIAASKDIPFGTKLYFSTNYGNGLLQEFEVQDRGGAITENCIDIFVGDSSKHQLANELGVYYTEVFIKYEEKEND